MFQKTKYYSVSLKVLKKIFPINFDEQKIEQGKSLEGMPLFTVREIEDYKKESGKNDAAVEKTSEIGL